GGPPIISRISPTSGPSTAGNTINIHGSSFTPGSQVTIDGVSASNVTFIDTTRLSATIPAGATGTTATVAVTSAFGSAAMANAYTYVDPATILMQDSFNGDSTATWNASPLGLASGWTRTGGAYDYSGIGHTQQYTGASNWGNYSFEVKVKVFALQNSPGGIRGRINLTTGTGYAVWLYPGTNAIRLFRTGGWNIDSAGLVQLASNALTYDTTQFHTLRMTFQGSSIEVFGGGPFAHGPPNTPNLPGGFVWDVSNQHIQFENAFGTGTFPPAPIVPTLPPPRAPATLVSPGAPQHPTLTAN